MHSTLDRAIALIKDRYSDCYGSNWTVEQYMFGFTKSYIILTISSLHTPFKVVEYDNINSVKGIQHFDSRVDAHKYASARWLAQFPQP